MYEKFEEVPAPNAYDINKVKFDYSPAYTMRPKTGHAKVNDTPAPNQYPIQKVQLNKGPAYSITSRPNIERPNDTPGKFKMLFKWLA